MRCLMRQLQVEAEKEKRLHAEKLLANFRMDNAAKTKRIAELEANLAKVKTCVWPLQAVQFDTEAYEDQSEDDGSTINPLGNPDASNCYLFTNGIVLTTTNDI